ncbi:MAG: WYL domain-containing protein [Deinococcota bacterium]
MSITFARYLDVLGYLQSGKRVSATELAQNLGVSTRAVRRHIDELRLLGYDIKSLRGPQGGYVLQGGLNLLPMNFTDDEALALSYGLLLLKDSAELGKVSSSALARLLPSLPKHVADNLQALSDSVMMSRPPSLVRVPSDVLMQVSRATREHIRVNMRYQAAGGSSTQRELDPYVIVHVLGLWFVVGYCHLRHSLRTFRVDRIVKLTLTEITFTTTPEFAELDVLNFVTDGIARSQHGRTEVIIDIDMPLEDAQDVFPAGYVILQARDEGVRVTAYVKSTAFIVQTISRLAVSFRIVQPTSLIDELRRHFEAVLERLEQA